jgi:hypothetical protein
VKRIACERPMDAGVPAGRWSLQDLRREVLARGLVATVSGPTFLVLLTTVATASLLSNLPVSLNGLGLREQLHAMLLQPLGVPREAAVAISLLLFAHLLVTSLGGFVLWLRVPVMPVESEQPSA